MYISGSFNGWSGVDNAMTDNGDGTWTVTVTMPAGANEYIMKPFDSEIIQAKFEQVGLI